MIVVDSVVVVCATTFVFEVYSESEICVCIDKVIHQRLNLLWTVNCYCGIVANSMSLIIMFFFLLSSLTSIERGCLVCHHFVYARLLPLAKTFLRSSEKKVPKGIGDNKQAFLTPFWILNNSDTFLSYCIVPQILLWKDSIVHRFFLKCTVC